MCKMISEIPPAFREPGQRLPPYCGEPVVPGKPNVWRRSEQNSGTIGMENFQMPKPCSINR